jgi:ATP-dependent RNA helicase DeaD
VAKFADSITASLGSAQLGLFRGLIDDYAREHDVPVADVAAALAVLSQDGQSFLMAPEPPPVKRSSPAADRGDRVHDRNRTPARVAARRRGKSDAPLATYRIRVGKRHKVQPGAIVGAIANEGGLSREDFGHIDIRVDHSLVELPADLSRGTLDALRRTRISGQLIDITREDGGERSGQPHRPRKPRRTY